jgi:hypothetical protein
MADSFRAPDAPQHRPRHGCAAGQGERGNHPEGRVTKPAHLAHHPPRSIGRSARASPTPEIPFWPPVQRQAGNRCELRLIGSRRRLIRWEGVTSLKFVIPGIELCLPRVRLGIALETRHDSVFFGAR